MISSLFRPEDRVASITIRGLDDDLKRRLRLRAARNGRSMEDEARTILRGVAAAADESPAPSVRRAAAAAPRPDSEPGARHVLLIIGGGIAAYKSLDLIRRLKERGATVRCVLTAAAQKFVTPLAAGALSGKLKSSVNPVKTALPTGFPFLLSLRWKTGCSPMTMA